MHWVVLVHDVIHVYSLRSLRNVVSASPNVGNLIILHQAPFWVNFWQKTLPITKVKLVGKRLGYITIYCLNLHRKKDVSTGRCFLGWRVNRLIKENVIATKLSQMTNMPPSSLGYENENFRRRRRSKLHTFFEREKRKHVLTFDLGVTKKDSTQIEQRRNQSTRKR